MKSRQSTIAKLIWVLGLASGLVFLVTINPVLVTAEELPQEIDDIGIITAVHKMRRPQPAQTYSTSGIDTIWVGYVPGSRSPSNPHGVGVGGVWNFDTGIAGTDSSQFWRFFLLDWRSESTTALPEPEDRPIWYFDHGNEVNIGDTNLWLDRENRGMHAQNTGPAHTAGYLRTGITGYWHVDDMTGVSSPIGGLRSAWCGLRGPSDFTILDEVTGNPLNGDLARYWTFGGALINGSWPGYGNQIDQLLYHDITLQYGDGSDIISFKFRTDMCDLPTLDNNGSAWFNPDPTSASNLITSGVPGQGPIDSLMVWVGLPQDGNHYDSNKRWLSEVIDFDSTTQPVKPFAQAGKAPLAGADTTVVVNLPAWGAGVAVRIVFQVKTNRTYADESYDLHAFDSVEGAALIDDVQFNGAAIGAFETSSEIRPRLSLPGDGLQFENDPAITWIATAKPPAGYGHIENVYDLPYEDVCGNLSSPDRYCNLNDNVVLLSNHDDPDHAFFRESWIGAESPTIDLSPGSSLRLAGVGDRDHDAIRLEMDWYPGHADLDHAVFWNAGARYHGSAYLQQVDELTPGWSDNIVGPYIIFNPDSDPYCFTVALGGFGDFDSYMPPPSQLDSLKVFLWAQTRCARFGATVLCGKPEGFYWDNIRIAFTGGPESGVGGEPWSSTFPDVFPFNEDISPGTTDFDTTTALVRSGSADTLRAVSAFEPRPGIQTRLDLIFRILPGPGNYSTKGIRSSPLWKVPSNPTLGTSSPGDGTFWGEYLLDNGQFGSKPSGHTGWIWDPNTWNSARMDSAEWNLSPLVNRDLGIPALDSWRGSIHEEDPKYAALGISRNVCFLVDPMGYVDELNVCCSAPACAATPFFDSWPPGAYPAGTPTTTIEGTKILPDGILTPGSHVEYFIRRSDAPSGLAGVSLGPDTTNVFYVWEDIDIAWGGQRFPEFGVFPDLWKDLRFGGDGLACMLVVAVTSDEHTMLGALDSLGYGKLNGAGRGWWEDDFSASNPDPEDPENWVSENLGQLGLAFDWYQSVWQGNNRPGCRLAIAPPEIAERKYRQSPTPQMLKTYYNVLLWLACFDQVLPLADGVNHDCNDVALIEDFLATSSPGNERAVWLSGEAVADHLQHSEGSGAELLGQYFATAHDAANYRVASGNITVPTSVISLIPEFSAPRSYGFWNFCMNTSDVISVNGAVSGGQLAARYEDASDGDPSINPGQYGAAVYRPADNVSRFYSTLITAFPPFYLRGNGFENSTTDFGRIAFIDDALSALALCSAIGPVVAVGDIPGASGRQINFVRGAFPNPSTAGEATVRFDLARPTEVTIRFYNIAGRLVHEANLDGITGPNVYKWDGHSSTGMRVAPGVYFYRLAAPGIEFQNNSQRLVILGAGR